MLKICKVAAVDGVSGEMLKYECDMLTEWLRNLINILKPIFALTIARRLLLFPCTKRRKEEKNAKNYRRISVL